MLKVETVHLGSLVKGIRRAEGEVKSFPSLSLDFPRLLVATPTSSDTVGSESLEEASRVPCTTLTGDSIRALVVTCEAAVGAPSSNKLSVGGG